jgi:hypothetical protein
MLTLREHDAAWLLRFLMIVQSAGGQGVFAEAQSRRARRSKPTTQRRVAYALKITSLAILWLGIPAC